MGVAAAERLHIDPDSRAMLDEIGFSLEFVFNNPHIKVWRKLDDRENCTLDLPGPDGHRPRRLHIKRYPAVRSLPTPADEEAAGHRLLVEKEIPAARMLAWGSAADLRSFVVYEDLAGYGAADKLIESGMPFDTLLQPVADLAARLHTAGLHHRDLYLCHFFARADSDGVDVRLIDPVRVGKLPGLFNRQRWIVKDLAQLWFSTLKLPITDNQRQAMFDRYCARRKLVGDDLLRRSVGRKVRWIEAHDRKLNQRQPNRNISIPDTRAGEIDDSSSESTPD